MANDDDGFVKISGGGPWEGEIWAPQGATPEAQARADEYNNVIREDETLSGVLHKTTAFGGKDAFMVTVTEKGKPLNVLLPEHGGLQRDCEIAIDNHGDGLECRIVYKGKVKIKKGRHAGKDANAYDLMVRPPQAPKSGKR